jgi:hypothetical protein
VISLIATKVGSLKFKVIKMDRSTADIILNYDKFVPDLWVNLFSINHALKKGHKISNDKITFSLSKGLSIISFDIVVGCRTRK